MDDALIRKLKKEDTEDICNIHAAITQSAVGDDFKKAIEQSLHEQGANYVAELRGKVVGYMISYILSGGFGISKSAWIAMLGVNPHHMGQGIGEKLANKICDHYQSIGIKEIYTSVRWDSADLLSFFKTLGFDRSDFINLRKVID